MYAHTHNIRSFARAGAVAGPDSDDAADAPGGRSLYIYIYIYVHVYIHSYCDIYIYIYIYICIERERDIYYNIILQIV